LEEEASPVWAEPASHPGVLAGLAGVVVRDRHPELFLDAHVALFGARHDRSLDLRDSAVIARVLDEVGLDGASVVEQALSGSAGEQARKEHEESVRNWSVFGVPTFILDDRAVFVRVMSRPEGDAKKAEATIEHVLELVESFPELNEYKFTEVPR
jgi:protein-disulfide isomerase-like protein with CxxC motif